MATVTGNYVLDNSSLANFQSWTSVIYDAFIALGWIQTADTGQAAYPIAAVPSNTYVYWIFRTNGPLHATLPIYIKVGLGYSSTSPRIQVTIGTGSDGTGTITGNVCSSPPWTITHNASNAGATTYPCYFSGDADEFRMYMWQGNTYGTLFVIERSKAVDGSNSGDYFTVFSNTGYSSSYGHQQSITASTVCPSMVLSLCVSVTTITTGLFNGVVAAFPVFPFIGPLGNQCLGIMGVIATDVSDGALVTVNNIYGFSHNYIALTGPAGNNFSNYFGLRNTSSIIMGGLIRYE